MGTNKKSLNMSLLSLTKDQEGGSLTRQKAFRPLALFHPNTTEKFVAPSPLPLTKMEKGP